MSEIFKNLHATAHSAGMSAMNAAKPRPVVFYDAHNPSERYHEAGGLCGFAWIKFAGNTAWGRWAKKAKIARENHPSGLYVWVREGGQSVELKEAYANAYAKVLQDAGIKAYAQSKLD